jgi:hypothetical protein
LEKARGIERISSVRSEDQNISVIAVPKAAAPTFRVKKLLPNPDNYLHEATAMPESVRSSERVATVPPVGARTPRENRERQANREQKASQSKSDETPRAPDTPPDETPHALDVEV